MITKQHPRISIALLAFGLVFPGLRSEETKKETEVIRVQDLPKNSKKPKPIKFAAPNYPHAMSRAGVTGSVVIEFIIDKTGNVQNAHVVRSNNPWFERPALDAIRQWKYTPAEVDGRPVPSRANQIIEFNLPGLWKVTKSKDHDQQSPEFQWETPPVPKMTMFPVYPFEPLQAGTPGKVRIAYIVGPQGRVVATKLVEATTPEFGAAVIAMIDAWHFDPARRKDGKPGYARLVIEYEFKPNGRGDVPVTDEASQILRTLEKKPGDIVNLKDVDQPLKPLAQRPPAYPSALEEARVSGAATIEFYVDKNGDAQLPRIVSSTAPEFGYAAVQAIATWRFEPAKRDGKPVVVRAQIPLDFSPAPMQE
jgi:TonB family protein